MSFSFSGVSGGPLRPGIFIPVSICVLASLTGCANVKGLSKEGAETAGVDRAPARAANERTAASSLAGEIPAASAATGAHAGSAATAAEVRYRRFAERQADSLGDVFESERNKTRLKSQPQTGSGAPDGGAKPMNDALRPPSGIGLASPQSAETAIEKSPFQDYGHRRAVELEAEFFKGRYNRSRARSPENIGRWRSQPDIANPGPDLANFPNSAFTLPTGRAYVEFSPFTYYGTAEGQPVQYNAEFLLRYGLTDDIELRLFGNGPSWIGGSEPQAGFSPIAFDTKVQLWLEKQEYFIPAAGLEAYIQTQWLGTAPFNGGTQPSVTMNFDQSLPFDIDLEYNLGATRMQDGDGLNTWEFSFQWGLQRDLFDKDFAVFVHGFYNNASLPRVPNSQTPLPAGASQNAVGAGFVWTVNQRFAVYGQVSGGTTKYTPSTISMLGLAGAF